MKRLTSTREQATQLRYRAIRESDMLVLDDECAISLSGGQRFRMVAWRNHRLPV